MLLEKPLQKDLKYLQKIRDYRSCSKAAPYGTSSNIISYFLFNNPRIAIMLTLRKRIFPDCGFDLLQINISRSITFTKLCLLFFATMRSSRALPVLLIFFLKHSFHLPETYQNHSCKLNLELLYIFQIHFQRTLFRYRQLVQNLHKLNSLQLQSL